MRGNIGRRTLITPMCIQRHKNEIRAPSDGCEGDDGATKVVRVYNNEPVRYGGGVGRQLKPEQRGSTDRLLDGW